MSARKAPALAAAPEVPPALMAALADPAMVARMMCLLATPGVQITGPEGAAREAIRLLAGYDHERAAVIGLDARNRVVASDVLTIGSAKYCIMDPAQIYRWALTQDVVVSRIIVAHNHPSGDATPSDAERRRHRGHPPHRAGRAATGRPVP